MVTPLLNDTTALSVASSRDADFPRAMQHPLMKHASAVQEGSRADFWKRGSENPRNTSRQRARLVRSYLTEAKVLASYFGGTGSYIQVLSKHGTTIQMEKHTNTVAGH